jgi:flagellar M-ring protein FliF
MAETQSVNQLTQFFRRLTFRQRVMFGTVAVVAAIAISSLVSVVNRPSYATLFSNVSPQDASKIVDKLKEKNVPYSLEDGGRSILVPKQQVYDLRLALAGEGLPQSSVIGYEIFDRTNLGISDFVQKINYRRALEGELARTILELEEVEGARVHIVVPEKALFKEDEKAATASVVLKLKSGKPLRSETIQSISHLVASSVEGLEASNVTIVDSRGVLLSENTKPNSLTALTSTQYELQQKVESYLSQKAQNLLEGVVGPGNALVQVNADLDFTQAEKNLEQYDPENTAVRSEQTSEEKSSLSDSLPPSTHTSSVTNYEINKTVEHIVESVGSVKRLSVAAMINGTQKTVEKNGQKSVEYVPLQTEELNQLTDIVKRAVGYTPQRNDEISVVNLQFGNTLQQEDLVYKDQPGTDWYDIGEKGLLVGFMLAALFIIRSLVNKTVVHSRDDEEGMELRSAEGVLVSKKSAIRLPSPEEEISEEALLRAEKRKRIAEYVNDKPDDAARLLKVWLAEE